MELFTVSFTTKVLVSSYDSKGNVIVKNALGKPIEIEALPRATAMSYKDCDGFTMTPYVFARRHRSTTLGDKASIGVATKRFSHSADVVGKASVKAIAAPRDKVKEAAITGDLSAAVGA
jgi:hypothetical protein